MKIVQVRRMDGDDMSRARMERGGIYKKSRVQSKSLKATEVQASNEQGTAHIQNEERGTR